MIFFNRIRPKQPLKELKWFDIGIVTAILFGQFIIRSTQLFLASFQPVAQTAVATNSSNTASEGAAYSSNMTLQLILLALALLYLLLRRFDFKQLPIRFSFHTYQGLLWALVIGVIYGLFYYVMYKKVVKNLLPFFLMHALADMFGSSLMYLLINWGS